MYDLISIEQYCNVMFVPDTLDVTGMFPLTCMFQYVISWVENGLRISRALLSSSRHSFEHLKDFTDQKNIFVFSIGFPNKRHFGKSRC